MKRILLLILAACGAALVAWRLTRYPEPESMRWSDPEGSEDPPAGP